MPSNIYDWKKWINKKTFPFKNGINSPKYKEARQKLFKKHGNGWWWGNGWWSDEVKETPMEYNRRKRKERGE